MGQITMDEKLYTEELVSPKAELVMKNLNNVLDYFWLEFKKVYVRRVEPVWVMLQALAKPTTNPPIETEQKYLEI